ncbi:MAG: hypothetical protein V2A56_01945 [bacterium]
MRTIEIRRVPLMPVVKAGFLVFFTIDFIGFLLYTSFFASIISMALSGLGGEFGTLGNISGAALIFGGFFVALLIAVFQTLVILIAMIAYNVIANGLGGILLVVIDTDTRGMPITPTAGSPVPDQGSRDSAEASGKEE